MKVHSTAETHEKAMIGNNTSIWNHSQIREGAKIGDNCIIGKNVYIDFDVQIGNNVKIQNNCSVYHGTTIEDGVFLGPHVIITNDKYPRAINPDGSIKNSNDWEVGKTLIKYGASLGAGVIILPNVTLGKFCLIGSGAVVTKDVSDFALVVGNPSKQIGYVCKCAKVLKNESPCPVCGISLEKIKNGKE